MPICSIFFHIFCIDVRLPIYQIELHNTVCKITLFPLNDNSLLLYRFTNFSNLEMTFPQVLLSAPVVPMYTPYIFWKSLLHFRPPGSSEHPRQRPNHIPKVSSLLRLAPDTFSYKFTNVGIYLTDLVSLIS